VCACLSWLCDRRLLRSSLACCVRVIDLAFVVAYLVRRWLRLQCMFHSHAVCMFRRFCVHLSFFLMSGYYCLVPSVRGCSRVSRLLRVLNCAKRFPNGSTESQVFRGFKFLQECSKVSTGCLPRSSKFLQGFQSSQRFSQMVLKAFKGSPKGSSSGSRVSISQASSSSRFQGSSKVFQAPRSSRFSKVLQG